LLGRALIGTISAGKLAELATPQRARHSDRRRHNGRAGKGRRRLRRLLLIVGLLLLAVGLLWIGQGTGVVAWPKSSFMIDQIQWAGYGAALGAVGLILIWQSQR
jgi:hypothetical protein